MLQLFESDAVGPLGRPSAAKSAFWSVVIHGAVIGLVLWLTLSPAMRSVPEHLNVVQLVAPPPPPAAPPPPATARATAAPVANVPARVTPRVFDARISAPVAIPKQVAIEEAIEAPPEMALGAGIAGGVPGGVSGGVPGGVLGGVLGGTGIGVAPPPPPPPAQVKAPPPPPPPPPPQIVQVSAEVQEAMLLQMVRPDYPLAAKIAHIQGSVRLKAVIDREGRIAKLEVVDGHPMLAQAAKEAVAKWRYKPTLIGNAPVEVATEIVVNFHLS